MTKRIFFISILVVTVLVGCQIEQIPTPQIYTGSLPPFKISELSLDERIIVEDAWKEIKKGNGRKAINQISKLDPDSPFYFTLSAYAHYLLNDMQSAEHYFKTAIKKYPDVSLNHLGLAQLYQKIQKDDLAFIEYREVLKKEPGHPWAKARYEEIKEEKTKQTLKSAKNLLDNEEISASEKTYLKALYYSPESVEAHSALADIYTKQQKYERAIIHLKTLLSSQPKNKDFLRSYAEALFQIEDFKKSFEVYKDLKELEPENQEINKRIEQLRNRLGIFELPSQYDAIPSQEAITKEDIAGLIGVKFQNYLEDLEKEPSIIIDISTSWASKYILKLTSMDILSIYPNHTFKPKKIITRSELAEIMYSLINYLKKQGYSLVQQIPPQSIQLPDVPPNNFYYRPITMAISYGILNTSTGGNFNPEDPVSGQNAIKAINILLSLIK